MLIYELVKEDNKDINLSKTYLIKIVINSTKHLLLRRKIIKVIVKVNVFLAVIW